MQAAWFRVKLLTDISSDLKTQIDEMVEQTFERSSFTPSQVLDHNERFWNNIPYAQVVAFENNKKNTVIGRIKLLTRPITYNNKKILVGGIAGVGTLPEKQNRGVANAMLKQAMKELKSKNCDIAFLNTDVKNAGRIRLYGRVGFVLLPRPHKYRGRSGKQYTAHDGMIAPLNSKKIFNEILTEDEPLNLGNGDW